MKQEKSIADNIVLCDYTPCVYYVEYKVYSVHFIVYCIHKCFNPLPLLRLAQYCCLMRKDDTFLVGSNFNNGDIYMCKSYY